MFRENTVSTDNTKMAQLSTISKVTHSNVLNARDLNIEVSSKKSSYKNPNKSATSMNRTSNTSSLLKTKFLRSSDHQNKDSTNTVYLKKPDQLTGLDTNLSSETLSSIFSDEEKYGTQSMPHSASLKIHDPVKRIIRKVLRNVEGVSDHVDRVVDFQMRRQTEEMDMYTDHQLQRIMLDIRAAEQPSTTQEQDAPVGSGYFNYKRINNNRASRLSRLKKKMRLESSRLGLFCYNQFNEDLDRESRRLRAKIEKQLQFLAEGGVNVDAEIRLRAKVPKTGNELIKVVSHEYLSLSGEYPMVTNEPINDVNDCSES